MTAVGAQLVLLCALLLADAPSGWAQKQPGTRRYSVSQKIGSDPQLGPTLGIVSSFGIASNGNVIVLDRVDMDVKEYDRDGRFVRRFGRKGSGPGEFRSPNFLVVTDSTIRVRDLNNGDISYSRTGTFLSVTRGQSWIDGRMRAGYKLIVNHNGLEGRVRSEPGGIGAGSVSLTIVSDGGKTDTIARFHDANVSYVFSDGRTTRRSAYFGATAAWSQIGDTAIVVVDGLSGQVNWFSVASGRLV